MRSPVYRSVALVGALAAGLCGSMPDRAEAAVRLCRAMISSGLQEARGEQQARAQAISAWVAAASVHGERYSAWHVAIDKSLTCSQASDGQYKCLAKALPCTISQVPVDQAKPYKKPGVDG